MKLSLIIIFSLFTFIFLGCPLKTSTGIDSGSYDIPERLAGTWVDDDDATTYFLNPDEDEIGIADLYEYDSTGNINSNSGRVAIFSMVKNKVFVSISQEINKTSGEGFFLYWLNEISDGEIELIPLKEDIVEYEIAQEDLQEWLGNHFNDSTIYDYSDIKALYKEDSY